MSSEVTLESSTSSVTYEITMYNNSSRDYVFIGTLTDGTDETLYSNPNIGYTINGLTEHVTTIAPKASLTFTITFAFIEGADTTNNVLESIINFRFKELPILELSNNGTTYTLENIYAGYTQEYEFTVSNYNKTTNNTVPMRYSFETGVTEGCPLEVEIYNESGEKVTGEIDIGGEGQEDHVYTAKIIWNESKDSTEYQGQEYTCNIILKAKPTEEKYLSYTITKAFNVEITTCSHKNDAHNYVDGICTLCGEKDPLSVLAGEKTTQNAIYSDGTNTAIIPEGFTVSGVESEQTIADGLVIYLIPEGETVDWNGGTSVATAQQTYDQFVWIPIDDINDMYMCQSEDGTKSCNITVQEVNGEEVAYCTTHSSTAMAGRLYATSSKENYTASLTTQTYSSESPIREPDVVTGTGTSYDGSTTNLAQLNGILETSYASASDLKTDLQDEYNNIVKRVYQNEGFYIGRYETSGMQNTDTNATVKVVAGSDNSTNSNISDVTWYRMYAQQKKYAENKGLTSSIGSTMIQGAAYDQVMKFVDPTTSFVKTTGRVSHNLSAVYQTGGLNYAGTVTYNDVAKNIYDLEGNVYAWTTEVLNDYVRTARGGNYVSSSSPSYRYYGNVNLGPSGSDSAYGSVCQLYLQGNLKITTTEPTECSAYKDGVCTICGKECEHSYSDGICTICGKECEHSYLDGTCTICGKECEHSYSNGVCTICGASQPAIPISTAEQLLKIGSNEEVTIDGTTYTFSADENYELQNNITFAVSDYLEQYPDSFGEGTVIAKSQTTNYETANSSASPYYTYTAPATGTYILEVWGAQGGAYNTTYAAGGKGAYAAGTATLNEGQQIYIYVGGKGGTSSSTSSNATGGYNGGGTGVRRYSGGGGGATHMATSTGLLSSLSSNTDAVLIVAGAGGGAGYYSSTYCGYGGYAGGSGSAGAGYCKYYSSSSSSYAVGQGASTSSGGSAGSVSYSGTAGSFGKGGNAATSYYSTYSSAGGGGAGYYGGGGAGAYNSSYYYRYSAGGGGGSSYVSSSLTNTSLIAGNENMTSPSSGESETGHSGDGYARITLEKGKATVNVWIDVDTQIENGTLTGKFIYNGYTITVTDEVGQTTYPIIPVETITISGENTVGLGEETQLTATVLPENASYKDVEWSSSDETIAIVDETTGIVKGIGKGTATITATADGKTATYIITIIGATITFLIVVGEVFTTKENLDTIEFPEETPTKDGYNFTGWYYDEECKNQAQEGDSINTSTTLYAGWEEEGKVDAITNKQNGASVWNSGSSYPTLGTVLTYTTTKEIKSCSIVEVNDSDYVDTNLPGTVEGEGFGGVIYTESNFSFSKDSADSKNAVFSMTSAGTWDKSQSVVKYTYIGIRIDFTDGTYDTDYFIFKAEYACLIAGTKIKLKDGSEKTIEDITYEDELLVWDFDNGCLSSAKPLWIQKKRVATEYNYLKFENGSELKTINQHRIFNKELGKFTYPMTDETPIGTTTITSDGTETKLISKEVVKETVDYYNVITDYHINLFANNILTSCRLSNLYEIKDMKYVKDGRKLAPKEEYKNIPDKYFKGLRIAEQPKEINRGNDDKHDKTLEDYVNRLIANEKTLAE